MKITKYIDTYLKETHGIELDLMDTGGGYQSYYHELNTRQDSILICDYGTGGLPTEESKKIVIEVQDRRGEELWSGYYNIESHRDQEYVTGVFDSILNLWGY